MGPKARANGAEGRPREAPQTATAGAFGAREINKVYDVTVWGQLPALRRKPMRKLGTRARARMRSRFSVPFTAIT